MSREGRTRTSLNCLQAVLPGLMSPPTRVSHCQAASHHLSCCLLPVFASAGCCDKAAFVCVLFALTRGRTAFLGNAKAIVKGQQLGAKSEAHSAHLPVLLFHHCTVSTKHKSHKRLMQTSMKGLSPDRTACVTHTLWNAAASTTTAPRGNRNTKTLHQ